MNLSIHSGKHLKSIMMVRPPNIKGKRRFKVVKKMEQDTKIFLLLAVKTNVFAGIYMEL